MISHQQKQLEVIGQIEEQVGGNSLDFSVVSPVEDFDSDSRICLTSVHLPKSSLKTKVLEEIITPLKKSFPQVYFYANDSLHMSIKNIRVINDPPHFNKEDIEKARVVFSEVIPRHFKFRVYFYRLFLFPNNLALFGTTDPELDNIVLELDNKLKEAGVADDKHYINSKYFFSNMTLARFQSPPQGFAKKVSKLSSQIKFDPYLVDSVSLLTANAVLKDLTVLDTWKLS